MPQFNTDSYLLLVLIRFPEYVVILIIMRLSHGPPFSTIQETYSVMRYPSWSLGIACRFAIFVIFYFHHNFMTAGNIYAYSIYLRRY